MATESERPTIIDEPNNGERPTIVDERDNGVSIAAESEGAEVLGEAISVPEITPILPIRNLVLFPGSVVPLGIAREKSRLLLNDVLPHQKVLVAICQRDADTDDPSTDDVYQIGTAMLVLKLLRMEDGSQTAIVHGLSRVRIEEWVATEPYMQARVTPLADDVQESTETEALLINVRNLALKAISLAPNVPDEAGVVLSNIEQPGAMTDFLAFNLDMDIPEKQALLEELDVTRRLRTISAKLQHQVEVLELSDKIQGQVRDNIEKSQREFYLQEQMKAIQKELGQVDDKTVEVAELRERIAAARMTETIGAECLRELGRMEKTPSASAEYNVIRTYLDWMVELPWSTATEDKLDVNRAEDILNEDHYDLDKVKRRVLEYLAVRKLAPDSRGPILCFVGPPGVGKTSLGQSIARALGREFIRMSLGGMRDEAELRGHRRTYIGAMPGRIIQEIRKAGTNNPVFMLDELDKVGADFRGDPTAALLEVLDPAQNGTFQDHYLNVPFDLSKVMFIATANYMQPVPPALRDRMETIELLGYTHREKVFIATRYLVKRQLADNGLKPAQAKWTRQAIDKIIADYTREAGVRELERQIGTVCRAVAALIAAGKARSRTITPKLVVDILGPAKYESEMALRTSSPGVATGLAYTPTGGEILFVEATMYDGGGRLTLTGQIGDVMKESAQAALSLIKSRISGNGEELATIGKKDIHIHVPAGAIPKDGPSAGVAIFTALHSLLTRQPVLPDVAMTGEITLRGLVMPVGGVKEKVLAARRAGIKTVILPTRNKKDVADVPADAKKDLKFVFASKVEDVIGAAFLSAAKTRKKKKNSKKKR
ncbi:MAG: endopeptidase La [Planctomycetota bacterium]|jgi:ATP-dependent Lon protease